MQNNIEITQMTATKLIRAQGCVVLCGRVTYPRLVGEEEGIERFNEAYEIIAQTFLNQGLTYPATLAEKEWLGMDQRGKYGFARWEILCQITPWIANPTQVLPTCGGKQEDVLCVQIKTTANRKYGRDIKVPFVCQHIWQFPQGVLLCDREIKKVGIIHEGKGIAAVYDDITKI